MRSASAAGAARFGAETRGLHAVPLSDAGLGDGAPKSGLCWQKKSRFCLSAAQWSDVRVRELVQPRHRGTRVPAAVVLHE